MSVLVSDQDRGGDVLARIAPSKTVKLSEYSKSRVDGVWRIAGSDCLGPSVLPGRETSFGEIRLLILVQAV